MAENPELIDNKESGRYELPVDGKIAYVEYEINEGTVQLMHTEVPDGLGGQGIGSKLVKAVLEHVKSKGFQIKVGCPFISHYMQKSGKW